MHPNKNPDAQAPNPTPSPSPDDAPAAPQADRREGGWRISPTATFLATTALAVMTGTPRWQTAGEFHISSDDSAIQGESGVPGSPGTATEQRSPDTEIDLPAEVWARLFSADEHAGQLTGYDQLSKVRDTIVERQQEGYRITSITLEGHASDEDNSVDAQGRRTGGLRTPSAENRQLAETRARDFRPLLDEDLAKHNVNGVPPAVIVPPVEDMVTPGEKDHITQLADKFGYRKPVRMIEAYNRQQGVPPEVEEYLNKVLASERKVVVRIESEKTAQAASPATEGTPGSGEGKTTSTDAIEIGVPLALFVVIPWYKRRREDQLPEDQVSETPAAAAPPEPEDLISDTIPTTDGFTGILPLARKDAAYRDRIPAMASVRAVSRPIRPMSHKQPRPKSMHGHKGSNRHLERSRGGDRWGKTSGVG
jgi:hypothetical protein